MPPVIIPSLLLRVPLISASLVWVAFMKSINYEAFH
jgi:hypothetical protein